MRKISLFAEDYGHEAFVTPLITTRLAPLQGVPVEVKPYSVRGGYGAVEKELGQYVQDLLQFKDQLPDLVVVVTDSNCAGFAQRRKHLQQVAEPVKQVVVYAIPDPHIERWMLLDSAAFKKVVGGPCAAPDLKCNRGRYKSLLRRAVIDAGATPLLGGMEYAEDIVRELDLAGAAKQDNALADFIEEVNARLRLWTKNHADEGNL